MVPHSLTLLEQISEAKKLGLLDDKEAYLLEEAEKGRQEVIAVDDFADEDLRRVVVEEKSTAKLNPSRSLDEA